MKLIWAFFHNKAPPRRSAAPETQPLREEAPPPPSLGPRGSLASPSGGSREGETEGGGVLTGPRSPPKSLEAGAT
jgi:hypothetical protein